MTTKATQGLMADGATVEELEAMDVSLGWD